MLRLKTSLLTELHFCIVYLYMTHLEVICLEAGAVIKLLHPIRYHTFI